MRTYFYWLIALALVAAALAPLDLRFDTHRLNTGDQVSIKHHLPAQDGFPAVSIIRNFPMDQSTGMQFCAVVHKTLGTPRILQTSWTELRPRCMARGWESQELLIGSFDGSIYLLDRRQPAAKPVLLGCHPDRLVDEIAPSHDRRWVVSLSGFRLCVWNVATGVLQWQHEGIYCFVLDPTLSTAICGTTAGELVEFDLSTGRMVRLLAQQLGYIGRLAISPDGQHLAAIHDASGILLLSRQSSTELWRVASRAVSDAGRPVAAFSPGGELLVSVAQDNPRELAVWDVQTGRRSGTLTGHREAILGTAFGPGGELHSWDSGGTIRTWDARTSKQLSVTTLPPPRTE